ncbi:MAG: hypothetical protein IRZ29_02900, partial [Thermoflavifilum sp.]|nr:hypothetical protein [Thermoflavifilum sp.]
MHFNVIPSESFQKEAKRLIKKYPSLKNELIKLGNILTHQPVHGVFLGNNLYKIRIAIHSKGKGKSRGGRIISYVCEEKNEVYLLAIYDKSEYESINDQVLS